MVETSKGLDGYKKMKSTLLLITLLLAFTLPVIAQDKTPLGISIGLGQTTAKPGDSVAVFALVSNSTDKKANFKITFTSTGPCGDTLIADAKADVGSHRSLAASTLYPLSTEACKGEYVITATVESGGTEAKADAVLVVE